MSLFPSYDNIKDKEDVVINKPLFTTIEYKIGTIANKINNIDDIDDSNIKDIIIRQHSMILNYDLFLSTPENRIHAQQLFTNKRFLANFIAVIKIISLSVHEIYCLNKLAYDYYIIPEKDQEVSDLLYRLTTDVNIKEISILSGIIGMEHAKNLAMIMKSSFKEDKIIHRINNYIVRSNMEISVQNIIDILCYSNIKFTIIFTNTMLETKPLNINEFQAQKFDYISLALLSILESLPMDDIKKVIYDYYFILSVATANKSVRFSLNTANGFQRVIKVLKNMKVEDNIVVP
jgi:hypothetical protein